MQSHILWLLNLGVFCSHSGEGGSILQSIICASWWFYPNFADFAVFRWGSSFSLISWAPSWVLRLCIRSSWPKFSYRSCQPRLFMWVSVVSNLTCISHHIISTVGLSYRCRCYWQCGSAINFYHHVGYHIWFTGKSSTISQDLTYCASQALIFIIKREFMLVGWMVVYLLSWVSCVQHCHAYLPLLQISGVQFLLTHLLVLVHGRFLLGKYAYCHWWRR